VFSQELERRKLRKVANVEDEGEQAAMQPPAVETPELVGKMLLFILQLVTFFSSSVGQNKQPCFTREGVLGWSDIVFEVATRLVFFPFRQPTHKNI